jgi:cyclomaltodextrin glucanotransferase
MLRAIVAALLAGVLNLPASDTVRHPAAAKARDYRSRTIYFVVADRFHASRPWRPYVDPEHPLATNSRNCFAHACPLEEQWRRYWGGDIRGIIGRLGYLKRMGVSALWVTPLMENVPGYVPSRVFKGWGAAYHGYWVQNYDRVNPHFGGWDDVKRLSRALHANGMRYIQDITLNHSNPLDTHAHGRLYAGDANSHVFIDSYDNDYDSQRRRLYKHFQDTTQCQQSEQEPDSQWTYWQLHHCLLADLSGYDQRVPVIAGYLIDAGKRWLNHGVDDFRLDAIKFPFPEFVSTFTHRMAAHLAAAHRPAPYIVGEWSGGGVGSPKSLAFANRYSHFRTRLLDFSVSLGLNRFVGGAYETYPSEQLDGVGLDKLLHQRVKAFAGRDTWQGTFIDNHDQMRTMVRLQKLHVPDGAERRRRVDLATVLLMTIRGIPIVFYGDEQYVAHYNDGHDTPPQYINSDNDDPFNRIGMRRWSEKTPGFRIVRILSRLRAHSPAIWKGSYRTVLTGGDVLAFERLSGKSRVLVAVNRGASTVIQLPGLKLRPGRHPNLLAGTSPPNAQSRLTVASDGTASARLAHLGALVIWLHG